MNIDNVLVIVPAFNEGLSIEAVILELKQNNYSVLVVSDGSTDNTAAIARRAGAEVLSLAMNLGVGGALRAGFKFACLKKYEAVVQVDADGQHPISCIKDLINTAEATGAHMVIGSRFLSPDTSMQMGRTRRLMMRVLARSASRATQTQITDATSGFRIISQPLLTEFAISFPLNYLGDTYEAVVAAGRAGYQVIEIPASMAPRLEGKSSAGPMQAMMFTVKALCVVVLRISQRLNKFKNYTTQ